MARFTQNRKFLQIESSLGPDTLILQGLSGEDAINELYRFRIEAISPEEVIAPAKILNQPAGIRIGPPDDSYRWLHGIITHYSQHGAVRNFVSGETYYRYRFDLAPKMWLLTQRKECRIFQNMFTKDVVTKVLAEIGVTPAVMPSSPGKKWETCVQYMETDFAFVSRLMEEEGWFYFHKHSQSKHDLYIVDDSSKYYPIEGGPNVYIGHKNTQTHSIRGWEVEQRILPTEWETGDFSYLKVDQSSAKPGTVLPKPVSTPLTIFDYPGGHMDTGDQQTRAKHRMEAVESGSNVATGHGTSVFFSAGAHFVLQDHYTASENGKPWVIARVQHMVTDLTEITSETTPPSYSNTFTCAPKNSNLRPPRSTPRPIIPGTQTAIVTTAQGSMDPEGHGRVKVMFHWVAKGRGRGSGESCWVRVAQPFAGPKFGFQYVPQVNDEVIVAFMDGNPDHPLIIGSVHNGKAKYPWDLPTNWTQSGFRTRANGSGKYGEKSNVLQFEDKGGSEQIWLNASKDLLRQIAFNDKSQVGNDQDQLVEMNRTRKVGMNEKVTIGLTQHIKAGTKIVLECGASKITMDPASIKMESVMITIKGSAMLKEEAPMINIEAAGMLTLKGGIIFIN
ncbi:type VI secretion system Vgr family protein [Reyranella sp. CPCC 100927]|uniref:type VI secretion system Vgr family protein n=1 Tax=Reyranella sp. CPCC 100927 TaxID=2599616 RepID=UPI0011B69FF3|nr:type VI secretion system tip protein TssI/VgrG [Reyranella sp. CPCC 100927]TWT08703.1 type VI secretion system tip protein VgrG [Reyranella sp. CPCC 100927]